jgi:hypothetical protein
MSRIALEPNSSGSGVFTIASPNSNTSRTLNLPDAAGTVALQGGVGVGKVLQVVQVIYSTQTTIASTSYVDTGLSASITPTSATSKILVLVTQQARSLIQANTNLRIDAQIVRGSTSVFETLGFVGGRAGLSGNSDVISYGIFSGIYLDSPNTTSQTTYKTQAKGSTTANNADVRFVDSNTNSSITLVEIAA